MSLIIKSILEDVRVDAQSIVNEVALPTFVEEFIRYCFIDDVKGRHFFSDDLEVDRPELDILGRSSFARSLGDTISDWSGHHSSLVVAIYGAWGVGKSSVKKLLLYFLAEKSKNPIIIQFNPWEYSVQERIAQAFFETIQIGLGNRTVSYRQLKLARDIAYYASRLKIYSMKTPGPGLFRLIEVLIFLLGFTIGSSSETVSTVVSSFISVNKLGDAYSGVATGAVIGVGALIASIFVGYAAQLLSSIADTKLLSATNKGKTTWEVKNDLKVAASKLKRPVLLIIDDIDRLSAKETRELFQLVKSNSDLPNFIYLLLFDRKVVESSLVVDKEVVSGQQYLEKIIQVGFDVSPISKSQLFSIIDKRMTELANKYSYHGYVGYRFERVFNDFLGEYFEDIRDIKRFFSSFQFILKQYEKHDSIEVNLIDLAVLEAIRIREPEVYKCLFPNKRVLLNNFYRVADAEAKKYSEFISSLSGKSTIENKEVVLSAISYLFPKTKSYDSNFSYSFSSGDLFVERRICSDDFFDLYFMFSMTEGSVLTSDIRMVLFELDFNVNRFVSRIVAIEDVQKIRIVLSKLELYYQDISYKRYCSILWSMDKVLSIAHNWSDADELAELFCVFNLAFVSQRDTRFTESKGDYIEKLRAIIIHAARSSNERYAIKGLALICDYYQERKRSGFSTYIDDRVSGKASSYLRRRINLIAKNGNLIDNKFLSEYIRVWVDLDGSEVVNNWVKNTIEVPGNILKLLAAFEYVAPNIAETVINTAILEKVGCVENIVEKIKQNNLIHPLVEKFINAVA